MIPPVRKISLANLLTLIGIAGILFARDLVLYGKTETQSETIKNIQTVNDMQNKREDRFEAAMIEVLKSQARIEYALGISGDKKQHK